MQLLVVSGAVRLIHRF